ncbi:membrane protein containing DUF1634, partial [mine drainage metagenome]
PIGELASTSSKINSSMFSFSDMINGLLSYQGLDFMLLGVIVLIITPIARVIASVLSFIYERNWLYVVITLIVFINIMVAIFVVPGLLGH